MHQSQNQTDVDILLRQAEMSQQLMEEQVTTEFAHLNILKELNACKRNFRRNIEKRENLKINLLKMQEMSLQIAQRELSQVK